MSRLGRDYLKVGYYTEVFFPGLDIRFIAINNGVDSEKQQDSDFTPFLNIINEWYAKDTSKKIRAVFKAKGNAGKPLAVIPPYGYLKAPDDKFKWIVDEEAAEVVREMFSLCIKGYGVSQIASELTRRKIPIPTAHLIAVGAIKSERSFTGIDEYFWSAATVTRILQRQEYLGHTVNFKTHTKSYKDKRLIENDPSEWVVFENTHEAIIDRETFDIVQRIRQWRRVKTPCGEMPVLSGMLFCADCGKKLYQVRGNGWAHDKEYFVCSTYRKKKGGCSSHQIRNVVVEQLLLQQIQAVTAFARERENEFVALIADKSEQELDRQIRDSRKELEQSKARIAKLDGIIQRLYEDNIEGKISDDRFARMTAAYEAEQTELTDRVSELGTIIENAKCQVGNVDRFLALVRRYTDVKELDAEIVRTFVKRIVVCSADKSSGRRQQHIDVEFNFIGKVILPSYEKTA